MVVLNWIEFWQIQWLLFKDWFRIGGDNYRHECTHQKKGYCAECDFDGVYGE